MATSSADWITCGEAERLVNAITVGNKDRKIAFCGLLTLARNGQVAVRAEKAEFWSVRDFSDDTDWQPFDISAASPFSRADQFFTEVARRYRLASDDGADGSFITGVFSFVIFRASPSPNDERQSVSEFFNVVGLQFCRSDIVKHFGSPLTEIKSAPDQSAAFRKEGRAKGSGSYAEIDRPLIDEMRNLIIDRKVPTPEAAAVLVAHRAFGKNTSLDSKRTRLAKRYRALFRDAEPNGAL